MRGGRSEEAVTEDVLRVGVEGEFDLTVRIRACAEGDEEESGGGLPGAGCGL